MKGRKIVKLLTFTLISIILLTSITTAVYVLIKNKYGLSREELDNVKLLLHQLQGRSGERQEKIGTYREICLNIIMTQADDNNEITNIMLEVINASSGKEMFINIPGNTRITMSNSLYIELQGETPIMPQIVQMKMVMKHAGEEKGPIYVKKILEDFLGIEIAYYTVMPEIVFFELLAYKEDVFTISDRINELLKLPVTKRRTSDIMKKLYEIEGFKTNMPLEIKFKYLEFYEGLKESDIIFFMAEGKNMNEAFIMDADKVNQIINGS